MSIKRKHSRKHLLSVIGPTAIGKTAVSIKLANDLKSVIISSDSRQFYREMNIGTAKPTKEEREKAEHFFVDSLSIHDDYSAGKFENDALKLLTDLFKEKNSVIMTGGSGLYCRAVWEGFDDMPKIEPEIRDHINKELAESGLESLVGELQKKDPEYYEKVDKKNPQRVIRALEVIRTTGKKYSDFRNRGSTIRRSFTNIKLGLELDREVIYQRINDRMDSMIASGLFDEAQNLFPYRHLNALQTVGYTEIFDFLEGKYDYDEAVRLLKRNSRRYAKRQLTWFKRDPEITWFRPDEYDKIKDWIVKKLDA